MPQLYKKEDPRRKKTFVRKLSVYDKKASINSVNRLAWKYIDNHALFYCRISTNRSRHSNPELIIMMIIPRYSSLVSRVSVQNYWTTRKIKACFTLVIEDQEAPNSWYGYELLILKLFCMINCIWTRIIRHKNTLSNMSITTWLQFYCKLIKAFGSVFQINLCQDHFSRFFPCWSVI